MLHATLIARRRDGRWRGVMLEGPSGSGKSDLALRAIQAGWTLVADDRVLVWTSGGRLFGRAPATLQGLIEVRGVGVLNTPFLGYAEIILTVACLPRDAAAPERTPELAQRSVLGLATPLISLRALEGSAVAKLEIALTAAPFDSGAGRRI